MNHFRLFGLILLLFVSSHAMAQYTIMGDDVGLSVSGQDLSKYEVIDSSFINISYEYNCKNSEIDDTLGGGDELQLMIGKKYTKFYSLGLHDLDIYNSEIQKRFGDGGGKSVSGCEGYEIFNQLISKELLITQRPPFSDEVYRYKEAKPTFKWQLFEDTCTILGYTCNKATVSFSGRDYIAWYTTDIPLPYGPYKFGGLPGLIMQIEDTKNNFYFECTAIDQTHVPIRLYKWNYQETTRNQWRKFEKEFCNHSGKYMKTMGVTYYVRDNNSADGKREITNDWSTYYNPIEKE